METKAECYCKPQGLSLLEKLLTLPIHTKDGLHALCKDQGWPLRCFFVYFCPVLSLQMFVV